MQASTLGRMPPDERAARHEAGQVVGVGEGDETRGILRIAQDPGHAGEVDQLLRPERDGDRLRDRVGVDVVHVAVVVAGEARHHRHEPRVHERREHPRIDVHDVADVAVVHDRGLARVVDDRDRRTPPRRQQFGVDAGEADRLELMRAQGGEHVGVEGARVDHLGHVERGVVGDAPARHDHGLDAEPARERGGLRPAAVHHDDADAERVQQGDLRGDAVEGVIVLDDLAARASRRRRGRGRRGRSAGCL